jgi:hypothetical protein
MVLASHLSASMCVIAELWSPGYVWHLFDAHLHVGSHSCVRLLSVYLVKVSNSKYRSLSLSLGNGGTAGRAPCIT